jgi:hypothetical protein
VSSKYRNLYQLWYVKVFSINHNENLLLLEYPGRVRSQITSVVCQIQRFDFDCNLVVSRKVIIRTRAPLRLKPLGPIQLYLGTAVAMSYVYTCVYTAVYYYTRVPLCIITVYLVTAKLRTLEPLAFDEYCCFDTSAFFMRIKRGRARCMNFPPENLRNPAHERCAGAMRSFCHGQVYSTTVVANYFFVDLEFLSDSWLKFWDRIWKALASRITDLVLNSSGDHGNIVKTGTAVVELF